MIASLGCALVPTENRERERRERGERRDRREREEREERDADARTCTFFFFSREGDYR